MKYILIFLFCIPLTGYTQSPSVTIKFRCEEIMSHGDTCSSFYKVIINQYKPVKSNPDNKMYSNDTSTIDWKNFTIDNAQNQFERKTIIYDSLQSYILKYIYVQQDYVFENIFEFTITRTKCGITKRMRFYFPVIISSFVTDIKIAPSYFIPGDFNLTNDIQYLIDDKTKYVFLSLKEGFWISKQ